MKIGTWIFLLLLPIQVWGQTFSGSGGVIPDDGTVIDFPLEINGIAAPLDTNFGLEKLCFSLNHTYVSDIQMLLISPSGKSVFLLGGIGGDGDNFVNTCLAGRSFPPIFNQWAPFTGTFSSANSLGQVNDGGAANGTWKLRIWDSYPQDQGTLVNWSLTFSSQPARPFSFSSSNLPLVLIDTRFQTIPDEPKIGARIKILSQPAGGRNFLSDSALYSWQNCGIEQRGSSSASFPKKSYGFEFQNPMGDDTALSILGMPAQSDWVLSANYSDKTFMRNVFAYHLSSQLGWYAPRTRYVEVILNNEYQGIYVLTEKIKRDPGRVNISKLKPTDVTGNDVTGGYIFKIDKTTGNDNEGFISQYPPEHQPNGQQIKFLYDYPKAEDIVPAQKTYIQAYVDSFENALHSADFSSPLTGYPKFANQSSFIDYFIVNEWSKNVDGYRISTYLTKPKITKDGGRLIMGPVWDYDLGWHNADYCNGQTTYGWSYLFGDVCPDDGYQPPDWWKIMRTDADFNSRLKCRWLQVSNEIMPLSKRTAWIDSVRLYLNEAQQRNFSYWPILGQYVWPNPQPIQTTYQGEISAFRNWLSQRAAWINTNLGGVCISETKWGHEPVEIQVYPNPVESVLEIQFLNNQKDIQFFDSKGRKVHVPHLQGSIWSVTDLPSGFYWIQIPGNKRVSFSKS